MTTVKATNIELSVSTVYHLAMGNFLNMRLLTIWLASFAILINALAMPLSHALSRSGNKSSFFAEICTSNGAKIIASKVGIEQSVPDGKQANGGMH